MSLYDISKHGFAPRYAQQPKHSEQPVYTLSDATVCISCVLDSVSDNQVLDTRKAFILRCGNAGIWTTRLVDVRTRD